MDDYLCTESEQGHLKHRIRKSVCVCQLVRNYILKKRRDPKSKLNKRVGNHQCDPPPTHPSHQHFPMQRELLPRDYITHFYSKETLENVCVRVRV